jgi:type VI secretion system secreted protein VgrG
MLITTENRAPGTKPIKDLSETLQRLSAAQNLHATLAKLAHEAKAQDTDEQSKVADVVKTQNQEIQSGVKGDFPEFGKPHLLLASPTGIETSTSGSTHVASARHTAVTTGQHLSFASGGSMFASVREGLRMFAHKAGMRLVAAGGDIDMRALADGVNILAKLKITQTANSIAISAKEEVVINGGGSYIKFNAHGIEQGSKGKFMGHAAEHCFMGASCLQVSSLEDSTMNSIPLGFFDEQFRLISNDGKTPVGNKRYRITAEDGTEWEGKTNDEGLTERVFTSSEQKLSLILIPDED